MTGQLAMINKRKMRNKISFAEKRPEAYNTKSPDVNI